MADNATLEFYARNAVTYAAQEPGPFLHLGQFLARLAPGAAVLELGTGGGHDAAHMIAAGYDVTPTDASPELAKQAEARIGRPVLIMRFDELEADAGYDGVWASACLLHAPVAELTDDLARIHRSLKPGGIFHASFKAGRGEGYDALGRYYNYRDPQTLVAHYRDAANWTSLDLEETDGSGYDGQPTRWLWVRTIR